MKLGIYIIIVKNAGGYEIDNQSIVAYDATDAIRIYLKEYNPPLEKGDTIEISED